MDGWRQEYTTAKKDPHQGLPVAASVGQHSETMGVTIRLGLHELILLALSMLVAQSTILLTGIASVFVGLFSSCGPSVHLHTPTHSHVNRATTILVYVCIGLHVCRDADS